MGFVGEGLHPFLMRFWDRFEDLYGLLYNPDWLETARRHVSRNKGKNTPGVDGMTMTQFEANLEGNMMALRTTLKAGTFTPDLVRRRILREVKSDSPNQQGKQIG